MLEEIIAVRDATAAAAHANERHESADVEFDSIYGGGGEFQTESPVGRAGGGNVMTGSGRFKASVAHRSMKVRGCEGERV